MSFDFFVISFDFVCSELQFNKDIGALKIKKKYKNKQVAIDRIRNYGNILTVRQYLKSTNSPILNIIRNSIMVKQLTVNYIKVKSYFED